MAVFGHFSIQEDLSGLKIKKWVCFLQRLSYSNCYRDIWQKPLKITGWVNANPIIKMQKCRFLFTPARLLNLFTGWPRSFVLATNDLSFLPFVDFAVHTRNSHYQSEFGDDIISPLQPKVRLTSELLIFAYIYGGDFQSNQILVKH